MAGGALRNCSTASEGCFKTKCCKDPGLQCYTKKDDWAQCKASCAKGPDPSDVNPDPWSCEPLGTRTPGPAPPPNYGLRAAAWVQKLCAGPGDNCNETMCCKEPGKTCFAKVQGWAGCKPECVAGGPDPVDANSDPWDCDALGSRTPGVASGEGRAAAWVATDCSGGFDNCQQTKCCKDPGTQCFSKNSKWAMCRAECTPGPMLSDADEGLWECKALGGRTPGMAQQNNLRMRTAPWVQTKCSKPGENCSSSMCCATETMQCYQKNGQWASCMRGCNPGAPQKEDPDKTPWTCNKLGPRTPRPWQNPSLYCFHVMMVNSYEADIVRFEAQHNGGVGIFACEQYDVFASDGEVWLGDGPLGAVRTHHFDPAAVTRSVDGTAGNTALFMNVWAAVKWIGRWKLTDWTIKADPDAVILPDRLRYGHLKWHTGTPCFIVNCNKAMITGPMMFGSMEAISRQALEKYFSNEAACQNNYQYGEDRWFGNCLQSLGAQGAQDFGMVGDNVCTGANCADGKGAYHPFKNVGAWKQCYDTASR